jgi:hypothetical protein
MIRFFSQTALLIINAKLFGKPYATACNALDAVKSVVSGKRTTLR